MDTRFNYHGDEGTKCPHCEMPFAVNEEQGKDYDNFVIIALDAKYEPIIYEGKEVCSDCYDEIHVGLCEAKMHNDIYGDAERDAYMMSDAYRDDCNREKWDWLKNEQG